MSKTLLWIGMFFLPMGLLFAGIGVWAWNDDRERSANAIEAQGTVIELARSRGDDGPVYRPVVEFFDRRGTRHEFVGNVGSSPPSWSEGETVPVLYPPASPGRAFIDKAFDRFFLPGMFGGLGLLFAAIGGAMIFFTIRHRRIMEWLRHNGMAIQANFVETYRDTSTRINGRNPYRVVCQGTHPATGKIHSFKSALIWIDPSEDLDGKRLTVMVDPANPKRHLVDLSHWVDESQFA